MKAITLWQPWASLIALGHKTIETRSWETRYRGPLAIHASKRFARAEREMVENEWPFNLVLNTVELPLGYIVATATLRACMSLDGRERYSPVFRQYMDECPYQHEFGNFARGRFAWLLDDVQPLAEPIPARGSQGLWDWEDISIARPQLTLEFQRTEIH